MKELYMEDIAKLAGEVSDILLERLNYYKLDIDPKRLVEIVDDEIFECVRSKLEEICQNDYKHHN